MDGTVTTRRIDEDGLVGVLCTPTGVGAAPGVLVLGGSEGGLHERDAQALAAEGFTALSLAYFGAPGLPPGLIDMDRDREGFDAAAVAGAAHRRSAEIVEPDGDAGVRIGGADAVGGIESDPAEIGHMRLGPSVAGLLMHHAVGAQEMAGHEPRRYAACARARNEDMRIILADAAPECKCVRR